MTRRRTRVGAAWLLALAASWLHAAPDPEPGPAGPPAWSATTLYNLGNAYARKGRTGLAVLNYERASLLTPNDPDIEANLRLVRTTAKVPLETPTGFARAVSVAGPTTLAWSGLAGLLLMGGCVLAARRTTRHRGWWHVGGWLGVALAGLTVCNAVVLWPRLHDAVVLTAVTPVRVSPVPMGDPVFVLPEAETVSIQAKHEGFALIRTRAGRTGWVSDANLAPVVPPR